MAEPTAVERMRLVKLGYAMPDGSYYIRAGKVGASDLQNAISAVGRGQEDSHNAIRVHIMKRAKALGLSDEIPDDWQPDGSLKHDALNNLADGFISHFGITGMRWGGHLPGTEAVGGKGNPDGANGPSAKYAPGGDSNSKAAFIQRGDHSGPNSGDSNGPSGKDDVKSPEQQANESAGFLKNLRDHVAQQTESARAEAEDANHAPGSGLGGFGNHSQGDQSAPDSEPPPPKSAPASSASAAKPKSNLTSQQASAVHAASKKHLAAVSQLHNKAQAAQVAHKKNKKKLATHPNKGHVKTTTHAASMQHAAHMKHLAQTAAAAHKAHLAAVAKLKSKHRPVVNAKSGSSHLSAQDKAALKQLSPVQRSALNKIPAKLRAHAGSLSQKQQNDLRLTPNERKALSHLSQKQKDALAKATAASAKSRHEAALARKAGITGNKSVASAKKQTASAQAHRTSAQRVAYNKLRLNAQNGTRHAMDDAEGTFLEHEDAPDDLDLLAEGFLEHHGVKGMHWGVRKPHVDVHAVGTKAGNAAVKTAKFVGRHKKATALGTYAALRIASDHERVVGTAKIVAHIIKVMNQQRKSQTGQEALAIAKTGMKFVEGYVIHEDDSGSLEHHGVKGMHWGVHRSPERQAARTDRRIAKTKANIEYRKNAIENVKSHLKDAEENGSDAELFKKQYGVHSNVVFQTIHGQSRSAALERHKDDLRNEIEDYHRPALHALTGHLAKLEAKQAKAQHTDDDDDVLEHYGIKGMHWGVRRNGGHPGREDEHPVSSDAQKAHEVATKIHEHGTAAVDNEDLQHLVTRQQLLQKHAQLNPDAPSHYRQGIDFVKSLTNDVNSVVNAVNTGQRAVKTINGLPFEKPARRQSRRTRNKPLKVVDIRAA